MIQPPKVCAELARAPRILDRFAEALASRGVVGEGRAVKLTYLILTTRFLQRPVSAAVKGPSSAGKSFLIENVLASFPKTAYYNLTAMSERVLVYTKQPLSHRFIVICEASALRGDMLQYLIRSLLSEGRINYEVVERAGDTFQTRRIEQEGPTGLLVTTTAVKLHPENETRFFSIPVNDSPEQTGAILRAIAAQNGESEPDPMWLDYQEWIERAEHRVVVPYATALANSVPPQAVRLRRDFASLLSLIKAHAILHQASREREASGCIVAALEDYAAVRELVADLFAEGIDASIAPIVRETVSAVAELKNKGKQSANITELAKHLKIDKSSAWRRVGQAVDLGYLVNLEERPARTARLVLGDPLPDTDSEILPRLDDARLRSARCGADD